MPSFLAILCHIINEQNIKMQSKDKQIVCNCIIILLVCRFDWVTFTFKAMNACSDCSVLLPKFCCHHHTFIKCIQNVSTVQTYDLRNQINFSV